MKILATGQKERREFESSPKLTLELMVAGAKRLAQAGKLENLNPITTRKDLGEYDHND